MNNDKPFYKRSEFWLTLSAALPGIVAGLAEVFLKATGDGTIDINNPLYPLFIKVSAVLVSVYTISRQINKAIVAFRSMTAPVLEMPNQG